MKLSKFASALFALSVFAAPIVAQADAHADRIAAVQKAYDLSEWMKLVKPEEASGVQGLSKKAQACLDALAAMQKEGKADGDMIQIKRDNMYAYDLSIGDARAMCERTLVDALAFEGAVTGREDANRAAVEQKYKDAGFKGQRLKLFVDNELNGGGFAWYGKGCQKEITDLKALKKAKKLFNWTNGANGGTLVTKCTFKGDKVKCVSKEFFKEKKAYAYCK